MSFDPDRHHRRSVRLHGWDYASAGLYHITICVGRKACVFGDVVGETVELTDSGILARDCWLAIPKHHPRVVLDAFVIMPNHIHGIVGLREGEGLEGDPAINRQPYSAPGTFVAPTSGSVGTIVGTYKAAVTRGLRRSGHADFKWQRSFHDHIIRSERSLNGFREYIDQNPLKWYLDRENPINP